MMGLVGPARGYGPEVPAGPAGVAALVMGVLLAR
jgi:hypothetical protein